MDFLREILGEDLFKQMETAINAHNGNEANKDKQIKLENIKAGNYVSKLKQEDVVAQLTGKQGELDSANGLIAELKKGTKGNEELQGKITGYETQVAQLQKELQDTKVKSAIKVGLLEEHCSDVDYVTYKLMESLKEKGETLELDESDSIKGWADKLSGLKTQLPAWFESQGTGTRKILGDNKLPGGDGGNVTVTKEQFLKMSYEERSQLKQSNEKLYKELTNK